MTKVCSAFTLRLDAYAILDKQLKWIRGNGNIPESYDVEFHSVERIFLLPFVLSIRLLLRPRVTKFAPLSKLPLFHYSIIFLTLRTPTRLG